MTSPYPPNPWEKNNGFQEIHERILSAKVLDYLQLNAKIEEVAAAS